MGGIPLDKAEMLAIFLETFFYGIFFTLFCITLFVLFSKKNGPVNRPLLLTSIAMLTLATGHIIVDFVRIMEAFITTHDNILKGPIGYYLDLSNPLHTTKTAFYVSQTLVGDSFVLWRCYVVYGRSSLAVSIPLLLLAGSFSTGIGGTYFLATAKPGKTVFETAKPWITAFFVLTLCQNLYCTASIVYRIWSTERAAKHFRNETLMPIVVVIVESGALYSSALLSLLITYLSGTNGQYPALDIVQPFVGIAFSLIIIQISAFTSRQNSSFESSERWKNSHIRGRMRPPTMDAYPLQGVAVEITTEQNRDVSRSSAEDSTKKETWDAV